MEFSCGWRTHDSGGMPVLEEQFKMNGYFLDTRESWEFDEGHIPCALNMPLRDITASSVAELLDKDLVQDIQTAMSNMRIKLVKGLTHTQAVLFRIKIAIFR